MDGCIAGWHAATGFVNVTFESAAGITLPTLSSFGNSNKLGGFEGKGPSTPMNGKESLETADPLQGDLLSFIFIPPTDPCSKSTLNGHYFLGVPTLQRAFGVGALVFLFGLLALYPSLLPIFRHGIFEVQPGAHTKTWYGLDTSALNTSVRLHRHTLSFLKLGTFPQKIGACSSVLGMLICTIAMVGFALTSVVQMGCWLGIVTLREGTKVGEKVAEAVSPSRSGAR